MSLNSMKVRTALTLKPNTTPASPENGDIYYDSGSNTFRFYQNGLFISFASTTLNNLTSTAINQNLIFDTGATGILQTKDDNGANTQDLYVVTGASTGFNSGTLIFYTGNAEATGALIIQTGIAASSSSGGVTIQTGNASVNSGDIALSIGNGSGANGAIILQPNAGAITAGQVWTATDSAGRGNWVTPSGGGANTALSNLASTAVNTSINPDTNDSHNLGVYGLSWQQIITKQLLSSGDALDIFSGSTDGSASATGLGVGIGPDGNGLQIDTNGGDLTLATQTTTGTGNSGSIVIRTGTSGAARGNIQLVNGSEGTAGSIWTSTDTNGSGTWVPQVLFRGTNTAGTSIPVASVQLVPFASQYDTASGWNGTDTFTIPSDGYYRFHATVNYDSAAYTAGNIVSTYFQVGAGVAGISPIFAAQTSTSMIVGSGSTCTQFCTAGTTIQVFVYNEASGGPTTLRTSAENNYFEIEKVG